MRRLLAHTAVALLMGGAMIAYSSAYAADSTSDSSDASAQHLDLSKLPTDLDGEIRRAQDFRANGKLEEAAHALGQLMLMAPDDPRVVSEYGKVLVQENRPQDAAEFLKRALQIQSGDWTVYSALGVAYDEMGDNKSAKLAYERALALKPGDPTILNNYARSRFAAADFVSARQLMAEAQAADPTDETIARNVTLVAASRQPIVPAVKAAASSSPPSAVRPARVAKPAQKIEVATLPNVEAAPKTDVAASVPAPDGATAAPRVLNKDVVMQSVPVDPLAGPAGKSSRAKSLAAKRKPATPSLRMSADAS
jgi:Flp pilus assembly protein TadD